MNLDDLIAAFKDLAKADPHMRIDRNRIGDDELVRLAACSSGQSRRTFRALATDAAALFDPGGQGDSEKRWLELVLERATELIEDPHQGSPFRPLGYAILDGGKRVRYVSETIPNAASASALAVLRLKPSNESVKKPPMTDGQRAVWDALLGSCKSAKELAADANTSDVTVRQHIHDLRKAGYQILHRPGRGYWRPDAPPEE